MPQHQFSDDDVITIKLDNGYNIGLAVDKNTRVKFLEKGKQIVKKPREIPFDKNKPNVSIIGTGGTIACYVDYRTGAVHPCFFGRMNMKVYSKGRDLLKAGVIACEDMFPETAYVKLMYALAHGKNHKEIMDIMKNDIVEEISDRTRSDVFL